MSAHDSRGADRREFLIEGAALLSATLLPAGAVLAQQQTDAGPDVTLDKVITDDTVAEAQKLLGIDFTPEERAMIVESLQDQVEGFRARRAVPLENHLGPLTTFRLDPDRAPRTPRSHRVSAAPSSLRTNGDEDIAYAPATALSAMLDAGEISSTELTEIYLERLARIGTRLESVVTITGELAMEQARRADDERAKGIVRGPLHGIPWGAKDLFDTKGIRTSWGAMPYKDRVPDRDALVVERLRDAGAVLAAKTTLGALAYGDIWFGGKTKNPFDLEQGSSGSSAGSSSGTVAGLFGFSLGTETLGSIVSPSMRCGATGLRPTFGRVSRSGAMALCWSLDKIGPICRSVEDCILVLDAINGASDDDPSSVDANLAYAPGRSVRGLRVGYSPTWFEGENANPIDQHALDALKGLGVDLVEITLPELPYSVLFGILVTEAAAAFEEITLTNTDDTMKWQESRAWPNAFRSQWFYPAIEFVQAERIRRKIAGVMDETMRDIDVIFGPSFAGSLLLITNFTGHPQLCLRAGFSDEGTPRGVSIWGHQFDEGTVCTLGAALERELDVASRRPSL